MIEDHELEIKIYIYIYYIYIYIYIYICMRRNSKSNKIEDILLYVDSTIKFEVILINIYDRNWW